MDPDDVVGSIKAKIEQAGAFRQAQDARLTLVAPYGMSALLNPVNLGLLRRYIEGLGLRAVLVSRDARMRELARAAGMSVRAGEPASAEEVLRSGKAYAAHQRELALLKSRGRLTAIAGLGGISLALALPLAAALVLVPSATVVLYPEPQAFEETVEVRASARVGRPNPVTMVVPAEVLRADFQVTELLDIAASAVVPARAQGRVVLTNRSSAPVNIPAGVQVHTSTGTEYVIQSAFALLPNQEGSVMAVSQETGVAGNVPEGAIDRFAAGAIAGLTVTNPEAMTGGRDRADARVTEAHHHQLRERAMLAGKEEALRRLVRERAPAQSFYEESLILEYGYDDFAPPVGTVSRQATLKLNGHARVVAFRGDDVNGVLRRNAAAGAETQLLEGTFRTLPLELLRADPEEVVFHMLVRGERGPRLEEERVKELVRGKGVREAEAILRERVPLVGSARVETQPFWAMGISHLPWRITVRQGVP